MPTITLLKWLPASWKSTWAKEQVNKNPHGIVRVNNDDLRSMLNNGVFWKNNEQSISQIREYIVINYISSGYNVIIDNTNLNPKHSDRWKDFCKKEWYKYEEKFFDTQLEECIARDSKRKNPVGEKVIRDMAKQFDYPGKKEFETITQNQNLPYAIICDIDGTIANMWNRSPYDLTKVSEDKPYWDIINLVTVISQWKELIFVSGRSDECKEDTIRWLSNNFCIRTEDINLYMRKQWDNRKDSIVKYEILQEITKEYYIQYIFDDRDQVVQMEREAGFRVLQVADWSF